MNLGERIHLLAPDAPPPSPLAPMQRYDVEQPFAPGRAIVVESTAGLPIDCWDADELRPPHAAAPAKRVCVVDAAPSCKAILHAWGDELADVEIEWPGPYNGPMRRALLRHRRAIETQFFFGPISVGRRNANFALFPWQERLLEGIEAKLRDGRA